MLQETCSCAFKEAYLKCYKDAKSEDSAVQEQLDNLYESQVNFLKRRDGECDRPCMKGREENFEFYICYNYCYIKITNGGMFQTEDEYWKIACDNTNALLDCLKKTCPNHETHKQTVEYVESLNSCKRLRQSYT